MRYAYKKLIMIIIIVTIIRSLIVRGHRDSGTEKRSCANKRSLMSRAHRDRCQWFFIFFRFFRLLFPPSSLLLSSQRPRRTCTLFQNAIVSFWCFFLFFFIVCSLFDSANVLKINSSENAFARGAIRLQPFRSNLLGYCDVNRSIGSISLSRHAAAAAAVVLGGAEWFIEKRQKKQKQKTPVTVTRKNFSPRCFSWYFENLNTVIHDSRKGIRWRHRSHMRFFYSHRCGIRSKPREKKIRYDDAVFVIDK